MSFLRTVSRASKGATCAIAVAVAAMSGVNANGQTIIIDDNFDDGITNIEPMQLDFFPTSSAFALDRDALPNLPDSTIGEASPLDFATGDSGRTIHSLFPAQTLDEFGESLTLTFDFTTPTTIAFDGGSNGTTGSGSVSTNEDFKFGLFDTSGTAGLIDNRTGAPIDFAGPIDTNSGNPNPGLNGLAGIQAEIDNINASGTDLGLRTMNVNSDLSNGFPSGQFLQTNNGFDFIAGGDDDIVSLAPNTDYTGTVSIAFTDATLTSFDVTVSMSGTGTNGVAFNDSFTRTIPIADDPGVSVGVNTTTFDLVAFHATSGAFGGTVGPTLGSSTVGEDNNGIDITNINITFTEVSSALKGDVDLSGIVDFADIPAFISVLQGGGFQAEADCDCNGVVDFADIPVFISILQGG